MGYNEARGKLAQAREAQIAVSLGERAGVWFLSLWDSMPSMLATFGSDEENKAIAGGYATDTMLGRAQAHLRLDYVCGLRREVRKQYVAGGGVCTDVTPFCRGAMSAHGADMFDGVLASSVGVSEGGAA